MVVTILDNIRIEHPQLTLGELVAFVEGGALVERSMHLWQPQLT